ncbi:acyltransferase [Psychromonas sp. MB-3u-54]|uniref:acyltransferase n=1 Tax=Psychromonas sp. MB-3u-54 TaxID=2058319 RepID=UPI0012FF4A2E|nr:acyltransferase [Psychromonas sp. MB-3u-54]
MKIIEILKVIKWAYNRASFLLMDPIDVAEFYRNKKKRSIGENTYIYPDVELGCGGADPITIGRDCVLTGCTILGHDASTNRALNLKYSVTIPTVIGDRCFIGKGVIILMGVTIGNDCIIGAGSVVARNIPDNSIVIGNPSQIVGKTSELITKRKKLKEIHPEYFPNGNK